MSDDMEECWLSMVNYFNIIVNIIRHMRKYESYESWLLRTGGKYE